MRGLNDLVRARTASARKTTRPRQQNAAGAYYQLCLLQREDDRLKKELEYLAKREKEVWSRLSEIEIEMNHLKNVAEQKLTNEGKEKEGSKEVLILDY